MLEASKLQQGDIMVCEMTVPTWVPLFATVSAIVADSGGILSHCAIVAREFRLPAVVGTHVGTTVIKDGMTITVDGTKGMVRIDSVKTSPIHSRRKDCLKPASLLLGLGDSFPRASARRVCASRKRNRMLARVCLQVAAATAQLRQ